MSHEIACRISEKSKVDTKNDRRIHMDWVIIISYKLQLPLVCKYSTIHDHILFQETNEYDGKIQRKPGNEIER